MRTTRYRSYGGGGNGGTPGDCPPTAVFADTFGAKDDLAVRTTLFDTFAATDNLGVVTKLFDTFGADDRLAFASLVAAHIDTFGVTEGALGVLVKFFETVAVDDRLAFADLLASYADTFGMDDFLRVLPLGSVYADTFGAADAPSYFDLFLNQPDSVGMSDGTVGVTVKSLPDTFAVADSPSLFTAKAFYVDTFGNDDALSLARFRDLRYARSGTPDSDPCGDSWVDQANPTVPHGADGGLGIKGKSTLANDEKRALVEIDFTRFVNLIALFGGLYQVKFTIANTNLLLSLNVTCSLLTYITRPFTESTVNWNNQPTGGVAIKSEVFAVPANSEATYTFPLSEGNMNNVLNNWAFFRFIGVGGAAPVEVGLISRETDAPTPNSPRVDMDLRR